MTLAPLINASLAIQTHVVAVGAAVVITPLQFSLRRGSRAHRFVGRIWMVAMALAAVSSFFIHTIRMFGPFSALHLLSIITLVALVYAYRAARRGDIDSHRRTVVSLVVFGLIGAGLFTFMPGRILHEVLFQP